MPTDKDQSALLTRTMAPNDATPLKSSSTSPYSISQPSKSVMEGAPQRESEIPTDPSDAGHAAIAQESEAIARAYATAGAPDRNPEVSDFVRAREEQIRRDWQYLESLPTEADRLEARRRGIGPMLPELAMSFNPPSTVDINYARAAKARILRERLEREQMAKEDKEKEVLAKELAEKELQDKKRLEEASAAAGKSFY